MKIKQNFEGQVGIQKKKERIWCNLKAISLISSMSLENEFGVCKTIAIIGAGVIGATTAIRLQELFGNRVSITIFSEEISPNTTGDVSAGLWGPYQLGNTEKSNIL